MCGAVVGRYVEFNLSGFLDPVDFWKDLGQITFNVVRLGIVSYPEISSLEK